MCHQLRTLIGSGIFLLFMASGVVLALVGDRVDSWQLVPGVRVGPVTAKMSETDLIRIYGKQNVQSKAISLGEGEYEPGTSIYPREPGKTLVVLWKESEPRRLPKVIQISGEKSVWKVTHGISLGTTLKELERLNGKSFILTGLGGGEYAGTIVSWEQGKLENEFTEQGRVILRLNYPPGEGPAGQKDDPTVWGDRDFRSDHPDMQKINPRVYEIVFEFK
jgi:hypothetical protein